MQSHCCLAWSAVDWIYPLQAIDQPSECCRYSLLASASSCSACRNATPSCSLAALQTTVSAMLPAHSDACRLLQVLRSRGWLLASGSGVLSCLNGTGLHAVVHSSLCCSELPDVLNDAEERDVRSVLKVRLLVWGCAAGVKGAAVSAGTPRLMRFLSKPSTCITLLC